MPFSSSSCGEQHTCSHALDQSQTKQEVECTPITHNTTSNPHNLAHSQVHISLAAPSELLSQTRQPSPSPPSPPFLPSSPCLPPPRPPRPLRGVSFKPPSSRVVCSRPMRGWCLVRLPPCFIFRELNPNPCMPPALFIGPECTYMYGEGWEGGRGIRDARARNVCEALVYGRRCRNLSIDVNQSDDSFSRPVCPPPCYVQHHVGWRRNTRRSRRST